MKFVLWIELLNFYCQSSSGEPAIVSRDAKVLDANSAAVLKGIRVGMEIQQARNILPRCENIAWKESRFVSKQREWLEICAQFSGVIEPIDSHIACVDLSNHPSPLDVCQLLISRLNEQTKLPLNYGAGPSKWIARMASLKHELCKSVTDPRNFISSLDISCLDPIPRSQRERLAFLGYRQIGDIGGIPLNVFQSQFGETALQIKQAAAGNVSDPVKAIYPPETIKDCLWQESPIEDLTQVDQCFIKLSKKISRRLTGQQSNELELVIYWEEFHSRKLFRRFTRPIHDYPTLLGSLRALYSSQTSCDNRIAGLSVSLTSLSQLQLAQHAFFTAKERFPIEKTVHIMNQVFGEGAVVLGSQKSVPRREKVLKELRLGTGWS